MEGVTSEASSLAVILAWKVDRFYDDNRITIDGGTEITFTEIAPNATKPTAGRFACCQWQQCRRIDKASFGKQDHGPR